VGRGVLPSGGGVWEGTVPHAKKIFDIKMAGFCVLLVVIIYHLNVCFTHNNNASGCPKPLKLIQVLGSLVECYNQNQAAFWVASCFYSRQYFISSHLS